MQPRNLMIGEGEIVIAAAAGTPRGLVDGVPNFAVAERDEIGKRIQMWVAA